MTYGKALGRFLLVAGLLGGRSAIGAPAKPLKVTMNQISVDGIGASVGTVTIRPSKSGVDLVVDLKDLAAGEHGFHLHERASCDPADKDGKKTSGQAAGAHWDPEATKAHKGPAGGGHKGDLPKLTVPQGGKLKTKLPVAGLTVADFAGKALMIHAGGDNYSDTPKPLGGGGDRVVCGVIPAEAAATAEPSAAKKAETKPEKNAEKKPDAKAAAKPAP
jgi:Cu-Zn family superoxide dismutase